MATRKNSRGTTLLVILQAWILPCHGFAFTPCGLDCGSSTGAGSHLQAARQSSFVAQPRPLQAKAAISRGKLPSLSMSEEGGVPFDPYEDEVRLRARYLCAGVDTIVVAVRFSPSYMTCTQVQLRTPLQKAETKKRDGS